MTGLKKKDGEVLAIDANGKEMILDITDDSIKKICESNGFPVFKNGDAVKASHDGNKHFITIIGVAPCKDYGEECNEDCYLKNEKNIALWISTPGSGGRVTFIDPRDEIKLEKC